MRASTLRILLAIAALLLAARQASAQQPRTRAYATRAELESIATEYAIQAADAKRNTGERVRSLGEETRIRERLRVGDFRVGDKIVVRVTGGATMLDTLSVSGGRELSLPEAGVVPLTGILRSELEEHLTEQYARYIRNATVHAEPLTRLAVLGEVRSPGFVHVPTAALLSDVLSAAGGPTANGSLDRVTIRREGSTLMTSSAVAKALSSGATLDDLQVRAGDEVVVDARPRRNLTQFMQASAVVLGSIATVIAIQHH